ncbi:right-handed parallel beta-helix repeat-containing protein [Zobellia sp. 1_MG-2023]|uniref:right-handed parallel beta-helix repeat-containing protein n=1 Tax=Zobellia sp. 1_MG-2023 TaxID=3062626 RepID=UPI0026E2A9C1|nr:right-handed parallel beta-helix repeat-containing protein [Zobellia sp. 1_MG-2023]MDO6819745.1 right-handed parallel beta-helix repeat-containing protein [Zobellia sp. 1_MG-2023]
MILPNYSIKCYLWVFIFITTSGVGQVLKFSDLNKESSSGALNLFFKSDKDTLIIDIKGSPWFFGPNRIENAANKVVILEKGVEVYAMPGSFLKKGDAFFKFVDCKNIKIIGDENVFCMNKSEYLTGEWRHGFSFIGCTNMSLSGIHIKDSGGDGIYIAGSKKKKYSESISIEKVRSTNNKRQGMSVISAKKLIVSNSIFEKTKGTLPEAGVDFEPNSKNDVLSEIAFKDCVFSNNGHSGILLALNKLQSDSEPISITFYNCVIQRNHHKENRYVASEITIGANKYSPVGGLVTFENCLIRDSDWGLLYTRKTPDAYKVIFKNCVAQDISKDGSFPPIYLEVPDYRTNTYDLGGFIFDNLYISYSTDLPLFLVRGSKLNTLKNVKDITGTIILNNSTGDKTIIKYINYDPQYNRNVNFRVIDKIDSGMRMRDKNNN